MTEAQDVNEETVKEKVVKLVYMPEDLILKAPTFRDLEVGESGEARLDSIVLDINGAIYIEEFDEILQLWEKDYHNTPSVKVIRLEEGYHVDFSNSEYTKFKWPKSCHNFEEDIFESYYKPVVSINK